MTEQGRIWDEVDLLGHRQKRAFDGRGESRVTIPRDAGFFNGSVALEHRFHMCFRQLFYIAAKKQVGPVQIMLEGEHFERRGQGRQRAGKTFQDRIRAAEAALVVTDHAASNVETVQGILKGERL
ncbi:Uncharacterised protein [Bacteroides xylanisolvens]|nr:Uncharacterised protein [Bacteroides xylanisolvens]